MLRELGDRQREGNTLCNLGMLCLLQGDLDGATRLAGQYSDEQIIELLVSTCFDGLSRR